METHSFVSPGPGFEEETGRDRGNKVLVKVTTIPEVRHLWVDDHEGFHQQLEVPRDQEIPIAAGQDVEGSHLLRDIEELPGVFLEEE